MNDGGDTVEDSESFFDRKRARGSFALCTESAWLVMKHGHTLDIVARRGNVE